jgi:hypothetical protein
MARWTRTLWMVTSLSLVACGGTSYSANLNALGGSTESGTVTVTDNGNGALIFSVSLGNVPPSTTQPSHVHNGRCGSNGSIFQDLQPLANASTTIATIIMNTAVNAKYSTLKGNAYVDVHQSYTDLGSVVACGDLN